MGDSVCRARRRPRAGPRAPARRWVDAPARIRVALTELLDETVLVSAAGELLDTARVAVGALLLGTGWPGPLAAVLVPPYIGLAWPYRSVPEKETALPGPGEQHAARQRTP